MPAIRPQPQMSESPLASLAQTIKLMGRNRKLLAGLEDYLGPGFRILCEDLEVLTGDHVVVGLRMPWARRVAVPILQAQCAMEMDIPDSERALAALDVLKNCSDASVYTVCADWLRRTFHVG